MRFELEKGSKKYICPACSAKRFVRYVKQSTNEPINFETGRCDRESSCGYHFTPKMYFAENPILKTGQIGHHKKRRIARQGLRLKNDSQTKQTPQNSIKTFEVIPNDYLLRTLCNYEQNAFVQFLLNLFPSSKTEVWQAVKDYLIGTWQTDKTVFWQIDGRRKVRTGKIIAYDANTGKRQKDIFPNWTHAELKKLGHLKKDFILKQCFFGEHLLTKRNSTLAIVEAEKTAVIASICFPELVWLAVGSKQNLKTEKLKRLGGRKIILYPDADGFILWQKKASEARWQGLDVRMSSLIEKHATGAEKGKGFDLADYLINQQNEINELNSFVNIYNAKLEKVLNDKKLYADFEMILEEQKSILIIDGKHSEADAEKVVTNPNNLRKIIYCL